MAALQFVEVPGYSALLLRRTYADLSRAGALMDRAAEWLGGRARWNGTEHRWTFPSGATLEFGYMDTARDRDNYRSAEYQFIGFDELTTFTEADYRFLFSRLRRLKSSALPIRMRGATNPGSIGHEWVKARFLAEPVPGRRFLPARLADNPHLDAEEYTRSLAELDPITRAQILDGDWDTYDGGRFRREWFGKRFARRSTYYLVDGCLVEDGKVAVFQTCDQAMTVQKSVKDDPDWTVISTWGVTPSNQLLWIDCERFRGEAPEVLANIQKSYQAHKPRWIAIEGGGTQKALIQLARRLKPALAVKEYVPGNRDKLQRAARSIVLAEAGQLYFAEGAHWLEQVFAELLRFTGDGKKDAHDDIVDTVACAAELMSAFDSTACNQAPYAMGTIPGSR